MAFDFFPFGADYHVQCSTMWALTDFTAANGATHILAGSSGIGDDEALQMPDAQAEMRRGSVLFYDGKVLHGAGANNSRGVRRGVNITYAVGWVRQEENQYLACPPEIARTLDDGLLRMMGYTQGAFALGYVGDQTDPCLPSGVAPPRPRPSAQWLSSTRTPASSSPTSTIWRSRISSCRATVLAWL